MNAAYITDLLRAIYFVALVSLFFWVYSKLTQVEKRKATYWAGCLRAISLMLLVSVGGVGLYWAYHELTGVEKRVVVRMRSSNEDCDAEFRCIWVIDSVIAGTLTAEEKAISCYLLNSKRHYKQRDKVEWIVAEGIYTNENGQAFYADCIGTLLFYDEVIKPIDRLQKPPDVVAGFL